VLPKSPVKTKVAAMAPSPTPTPGPTPAPKPTLGSLWQDTTDRQAAIEWAKAHGVHLTAHIGHREVTTEELNNLNSQLAKMPAEVHRTILDVGGRLEDWVGEGTSEHPRLNYLHGVSPRGWPASKTWDDVPGAGGTTGDVTTYLVVNKLRSGHSSRHMTIHEHAHTYEAAIASKGDVRRSDSTEWMALHSGVGWGEEYLKNYPEESFAESFVRYYNGATSRSTLDACVRDYFKGRFGSS
jgi:hypothetical protein